MKLTKIFGIVLSLHVGVILLVMFQPGCQTTDKKESVKAEDNQEVKEQDIGSFNQGLPDQNSKSDIVEPLNEFKEPTRPVAGELFVPGAETDLVVPAPLPGVIDHDSGISNSFNLRPANLSVYKIVKGDTLWGIARKNNVTLSNVLKANPNLSKDSRLKIGQEIMMPDGGSGQPSPSVSQPVVIPAGSSTYTVVGGDSLSKIARINGVSLAALMSANGMSSSSIIRPGQILTIPAGSASEPVQQASAIVVPDGANTHIVRKGENLTRIAAIYGTTINQIMEINNLSDPGRIRVGQSLIVSGSTSIQTVPQVDAQVIPADEGDSSVSDFFKGVVEEKPVIDVPDQP
ncbi:MAG: LysM peptidoglycan-binding domain-containing protein [Opitutae bacterium]|jgi:LysM repeat protein|nr:LysM peptidoglycan-binding domain-containing protein [Opitutae bacterium]